MKTQDENHDMQPSMGRWRAERENRPGTKSINSILPGNLSEKTLHNKA